MMRTTPMLACLGLTAALLASGCGRGEQASPANAATNAADAPANAANAANAATPSPQPTGAPAGNIVLEYKAGKVEFRYSWPREAAAIPALDTWLRGNGEQLMARTKAGGAREAASAKQVGYEMPGYSYSEDWSPVADLPALLVMQSDGYNYTGGAHGMPIVTVLFWDKAARKRLATGEVFDMPALVAGTKERFCKALDAEREKRRGEPINPDDDNQLAEFVRCVDLAKQTILPVSARGAALDTLRVVVMPYEAGPYSEGIYQIDLPVDATVLKAVKPAYKGSFAGG